MNSWYFTFEFPPDFGGGLSTYMKYVCEAHNRNTEDTLVVFSICETQNGLIETKNLQPNITLVSLNPYRTGEMESLGYWVNISRMFERAAELMIMQIKAGMINLPEPDYLEFADGFGIGAITIQQKLCLNSSFSGAVIGVTAHTPTYIINRLDEKPAYTLPEYHTRQMELNALVGADVVFSPSRAVIDLIEADLQPRGSKMRGVNIVRNPISLPDTMSDRDDDNIQPDHFFMASRLVHWKGVESAIRALEVIWRNGLNVPFEIYGEDTWLNREDKKYSQYINEKYAAYVKKGLIKLHGKTPQSIIRIRAKTAYAQIHPSHFDNFPYSVLEAMSCGVICVSGRHGGISEIAKNQQEIFLTDVHDPVDFAGTLNTVMRLTSSERKRISDSAKECLLENCSVDRFADRKRKIIESMSRSNPLRRFPFLSKPRVKPTSMFRRKKNGLGRGLSVVIPYYNMGRYIDETVYSVVSSTIFSDIDIIIVNDGSNDPYSVEKLERIGDRHGLGPDKLTIMTTPNHGVASARNAGAYCSNSHYLAMLDADDRVGPMYYEKAIAILENYDNVSFVGSWIEDFNEDGRIREWATWNAEPPLQLVMNQTNCQSMVYIRSAYLECGLHNPELKMFLDDWDGMISMLGGNHRGVMIPEALFEYRIRRNSTFSSRSGLWRTNFEKILNNHRELYSEWGVEVAAFLNANGPNTYYHVAGKKSTLTDAVT